MAQVKGVEATACTDLEVEIQIEVRLGFRIVLFLHVLYVWWSDVLITLLEALLLTPG